MRSPLTIDGHPTEDEPFDPAPPPLDKATSDRLSKVPQRNTEPELAIRRVLFARGLRYRVHYSPFPGTRLNVDIAFTKQRVAVFVDGCFWHGCPLHFKPPRNNRAWWLQKIRRNSQRDTRNDRYLRDHGWEVLRVWEHEPPSQAAEGIRSFLIDGHR